MENINIQTVEFHGRPVPLKASFHAGYMNYSWEVVYEGTALDTFVNMIRKEANVRASVRPGCIVTGYIQNGNTKDFNQIAYLFDEDADHSATSTFVKMPEWMLTSPNDILPSTVGWSCRRVDEMPPAVCAYVEVDGRCNSWNVDTRGLMRLFKTTVRFEMSFKIPTSFSDWEDEALSWYFFGDLTSHEAIREYLDSPHLGFSAYTSICERTVNAFVYPYMLVDFRNTNFTGRTD